MSVRITGGEHRGRILATPSGERTRPTQARLRQALLNTLQTRVPEAKVLDLFAGSGALGFEALSRGASSVVFVESSRSVAKLLEANARELGVTDKVTLVAEPVEHSWARLAALGPFDVILADPPYAGGWEEKLLQAAPWERLLAPDGIFCLEWGKQKSRVSDAGLPDRTPFLVKIREKNYGDSMLSSFAPPGRNEGDKEDHG